MHEDMDETRLANTYLRTDIYERKVKSELFIKCEELHFMC